MFSINKDEDVIKKNVNLIIRFYDINWTNELDVAYVVGEQNKFTSKLGK